MAVIPWNWPAYLPWPPNEPSVLPVLRSRIQTISLVPSATNIYFCCGSLEKIILYAVPQGGIFVFGGSPPQSGPREGVFGDTEKSCTHLPCLVYTEMRPWPRAPTYTRPSSPISPHCTSRTIFLPPVGH